MVYPETDEEIDEATSEGGLSDEASGYVKQGLRAEMLGLEKKRYRNDGGSW